MTIPLIGSLLLLSLFSGCSPAIDPLDRPIDATSARSYNRWLNETIGELSPAHRARYEQAMQQLGLELSVTNPTQTSAQRGQELNALLDGASPRQVIAWVELLGLNRLDLETRIDRDMLRANFVQLGNVRDGSDLSISSSIRSQIAVIETRIRQREKTTETTQSRLAELMPAMPATTWKPHIHSTSDVPLKSLIAHFAKPAALTPPAP